MNNLIKINNGSVLLSESALQDKAVMNALKIIAANNYEFKSIDSSSYNISDKD